MTTLVRFCLSQDIKRRK